MRYLNELTYMKTLSFDFGVTNVITSILSASIYVAAVLRLRSKKRIARVSREMDDAMQPLRS